MGFKTVGIGWVRENATDPFLYGDLADAIHAAAQMHLELPLWCCSHSMAVYSPYPRTVTDPSSSDPIRAGPLPSSAR
jgi:hypothetical protein